MIAAVKIFSAQVYVNKRDFEEALPLAEEGVLVFEETDDIEMLTESHLVAAEACRGVEDFEKALMHAEKSLQYACTMDSSKFEGRARRVLGTVLCETKEFERAEEEFRLSMKLLKVYKYDLAKTYVQVALLCNRMGQNEKSQYLLLHAMNIFENSQSKSNAQYCRQQLSLMVQ